MAKTHKTRKTNPETRAFSVSLPKKLAEQLQTAAKLGKRSRNRQVELIVEAWFQHDLEAIAEFIKQLKPGEVKRHTDNGSLERFIRQLKK